MSNLIVYDCVSRLEIANAKRENLLVELRDILLECFQIKGHAADKSIAVTVSQLLNFISNSYKYYTINEIGQILRNGFAYHGDEYQIVSVSNCLTIIRKHDEDIENRKRLQEAQENPIAEVDMSPMLREELRKKELLSAFKQAKWNYEDGNVNDFKINFIYYHAYDYVYENITKDILPENPIKENVWNKAKEYIIKCQSDLNDKKENQLNDCLIEIALTHRPIKEIMENAYKGQLFNLWALDNFEKIKN